jgi:hypothetical protein
MADGGKGAVGGVISLLAIGGVIYLKVLKADARAERRAERDAAHVADKAQWKPHALEMMKQVPDAKGCGDYLAWGVEAYHDAVADLASSGREYRDLLIDAIFERARQDGREDVTRSLEKVRSAVIGLDPDTWWQIRRK